MIEIYGVRSDQLPNAEDLKGMISQSWVDAWQKQHSGMKKEECVRSGLAGLLLLRCSGVEGTLTYSDRGRPYLADFKADFSISHTDGWIFCAVSRDASDCRVGLDAESGSRLRLETVPALVKRWFSLKEQELLGDAPDLQAFLRIWTRKEALVKWQGEGLSKLHKADTASASDEHGLAFFEYRVENVFLSLCASANAVVSKEIRLLSQEEIEALNKNPL